MRAHSEKGELEKVLRPKGPAFVMREEHRRSWEALEKVEGALERLKRDSEAIGELVASARFVVQLLSEHIDEENSVRFPMANQLLAPEQLTAIAQGM